MQPPENPPAKHRQFRTLSGNPRKRKPYVAQVVVAHPEACPECDAPLPGVITTFLTDQHFRPDLVDCRMLCRACETEVKTKISVAHNKWVEPAQPTKQDKPVILRA